MKCQSVKQHWKTVTRQIGTSPSGLEAKIPNISKSIKLAGCRVA